MNATIVRVGTLARHLFFAAIALIMAFPFYWMVTSALKTNDEIWQSPPTIWPKEPLWSNFSAAWHEAPFFRYMGNSVFVAVSIVILQVINSGMMAYALTHMKFRFQRAVRWGYPFRLYGSCHRRLSSRIFGIIPASLTGFICRVDSI